jgi:hypothetical protein
MLTRSLTDARKLGLALLVGSAAAQSFPVTTIVPSAEDVALAASQERLFSYGRSPKVAPSPQTSGDDRWEDAYRQARELVDEMTNDEKNNLTYGYVESSTRGTITIDVSKQPTINHRMLRCVGECSKARFPWLVSRR